MTLLFPASQPFSFHGRNVRAEHVVAARDAVVLRHSLTSDVSTVSATLTTLPAISPGVDRRTLTTNQE